MIFKKNLDVIFNKKYRSELKDSCLFIDRDGVIIKDRHYIKDEEEVSLEKGIIKLLETTTKLGWRNVIVTNQSGIFRQKLTWKEYRQVTNKTISLLGEKCHIDAIIANSEGPSSLGKWRKPSPEMLFFASKKLKIDLTKSIMVGDRLTDLQAGVNAKVSQLVHVLTGHGYKERDKIKSMLKNNYFSNFQANNNVHLIKDLNEFPYKIIN